jgi:hypothetical protein
VTETCSRYRRVRDGEYWDTAVGLTGEGGLEVHPEGGLRGVEGWSGWVGRGAGYGRMGVGWGMGVNWG